MIQVTEKNHKDARIFFLKEESYNGIALPSYFSFTKILSTVNETLSNSSFSDLCQGRTRPRDFEGVNYKFFQNKDGRFSWRPLELIHPAVYVALVRTITKEEYWIEIQGVFGQFSSIEDSIRCVSIPKESDRKNRSDSEENILDWWNDLEQESLRLALDYEYIFHTDVADCYPSIYSHSIAWALHTKETAKSKRRSTKLVGNLIDSHIQDMCHCQTNGIPQGSVAMDFIAEMVLGYADLELYRKLESAGIKDQYKILRYRDDYRIFTNNPEIGEAILKSLTEILLDLGLKLNSRKTRTSSNIIRDAIKPDKLYWLNVPEQSRGFQKEILLIHQLALDHQNSGGIVKAMNRFLKRLEKAIKKGRLKEDPVVLASIVVDIGIRNPRVYPIMTAVLSHLLSLLESGEEQRLMNSIIGKFSRIPNTSYLDVWIQRMTLKKEVKLTFKDPICGLVDGSVSSSAIWNSKWVESKKLLSALNESIIDFEEIERLPTKIKRKEVALFQY